MSVARLAAICFFISGASALIYELVWARMLMHVFGSSLHAVSAVTAVFLCGLAVGSIAGGRLLYKLQQKGLPIPIAGLYAAVEGAAGFYALLTPTLFAPDILQPLWLMMAPMGSDDLPSTWVLRFLYCALVLFIPTALLGATFPLVCAWACGGAQKADSGKTTTALYAANTIGAVVGVLCAIYFLLPALGMSLTVAIAALGNFAAASFALALTHVDESPESAAPAEKFVSGTAAGARYLKDEGAGVTLGVLCMLAAIAGVLALTLQIAWTRMLSLLIGPSLISFSFVLVFVLLGIYFGARTINWVTKWVKHTLFLAALAATICASYVTATVYSINEFPWMLIVLERSLNGLLPPGSAEFMARAFVAAVLMFPPSLFMGAILPCLFQAIRVSPLEIGRSAGAVYASNTLGCVLGAVCTGFWLIPYFSQVYNSGVHATLLFAGLACFALAFLFCVAAFQSFIDDAANRKIANSGVLLLTVAIIADIWLFPPTFNQAVMSSGAGFLSLSQIGWLNREAFLYSVGAVKDPEILPAMAQATRISPSKTVFYRDGLNTSVSVGVNIGTNVVYLKNDGKVEAALPLDPESEAPSSDVITQVMLGVIPQLLNPSNYSEGLIIGYGSGTTTGAMLSFPKMKRVKVLELEPAVLEADRFFHQINQAPLSDKNLELGRVHPVLNDARYVLASSNERFDCIAAQPPDPWVNGSSELFTREYFQLVRSRMKPRAVFCQWLPLYSIGPAEFASLCATFKSVFPNCALLHAPRAGEVILVGFEDVRPHYANLSELRNSEAQGLLRRAGISPEAMVASLKLDSAGIDRLILSLEQGQMPRLNTDDNMKVELAAAFGALTQKNEIERLITAIDQSRGSQTRQ